MTTDNTERDLCVYMYAALVYDSGKNIFESFIPLVEGALNLLVEHSSISFLALHQKINELYKVNMPKATLKKLLSRMAEKGTINYINKQYISVSGENFDSTFWQERSRSECDISDLFIAYKIFLSNMGITISDDVAKSEICNFVFDNCYELINFFAKDNTLMINHEKSNCEHFAELSDFLVNCKSKNNKEYQSLEKLYCGATQSTLLNFKVEDIEQLQSADLNITNVILDSNFIMRILDIQTENECTVAIDTLNTLKKLNIKIFVLKISLQEVISSIKKYLRDIEPYSQQTRNYFRNKTIRMSGLLAAQQRGKTKTELLELTNYEKLKNKLISSKIGVIEDGEQKEFKETEIQELIKFKGKDNFGEKQAYHDLYLIDYCRNKRKPNFSSYSEAEWWVLSSDNRLVKWNQETCENFRECITEAQISNLLWLKTRNMDNNGLINTMITLSNGYLVSQTKLELFINRMNAYKAKNRDNQNKLDKMALIFASDVITTQDIQNEDNENIEDYVEEKVIKIDAKKAEKEQGDKQKELELQRSKDENCELSRKLKKESLEEEILQLENQEILKKNEIDNINSKIGQLTTTKAILAPLTKEYNKAARLLGAFALALLFVIAFIYYFKFPSLSNNFFINILKKVLSSSVITAIISTLIIMTLTGHYSKSTKSINSIDN